MHRIYMRARCELANAITRVRGATQLYGRLDYTRRIDVMDFIRCNSCSKEPETIRWIEAFGKDDVAYDVGASTGVYSLVMALHAKEVYAFEPAVQNFSMMVRNIIRNTKGGHVPDNIVPLNIALSEKTMIGGFRYGSLDDGASVHTLGDVERTWGNVDTVFEQQVMCMGLDDFIRIFGAPVPTHIKIDVDGAELDIIRGMRKTLSDSRLRSILIEITHDNEGGLTRSIIEGYGFRIAVKAERGAGYGNYIFRR